MISYAQNAEDVVLARVLPGDTGFYVDVGASSPDASSVTRHFYEKGWSGINMEPRRDAWNELRDRRPRDVNLRIAIGSSDGLATLYHVVEDPDLSTIVPEDLAYLTARGYTCRTEEIPVRTMDSVLALAGVTSIDFLKIDAEGAEGAVLLGMDLQRWRPQVIVIEAVQPWSRDRADADWRAMLESSGYREGLFDGVNLFFAPADRPGLFADLVPASAVDHYRTAEVVALQRELSWHRARLGVPRPASPVEGHPISADPVSAAPARTRFAVVGSPHCGNRWVAEVLARAAQAEVVDAVHPAEVAWKDLPERAVIAIAWGRTPELERRLRDAGARVVSPARHPLDLLFAEYAGPDTNGRDAPSRTEGFAEWALSAEAQRLVALTAGWWSTPATIRVRYEDLAADPEAGFARLLRQARLSLTPAAGAVPATGALATGAPAPGPAPLARSLTADQRRKLLDVYEDVLGLLGYG
jgi:FkbM family methyltransferase